MRNYIPQFCMNVITCPCLTLTAGPPIRSGSPGCPVAKGMCHQTNVVWQIGLEHTFVKIEPTKWDNLRVWGAWINSNTNRNQLDVIAHPCPTFLHPYISQEWQEEHNMVQVNSRIPVHSQTQRSEPTRFLTGTVDLVVVCGFQIMMKSHEGSQLIYVLILFIPTIEK